MAARGRPRRNVSTEQIKALYAAGFTMARVAEIVGCSHDIVYRRLRECGVSIGQGCRQSWLSAEITASMRKYRDKGATLAEIGRAFRMTRQGVHDRLRPRTRPPCLD